MIAKKRWNIFVLLSAFIGPGLLPACHAKAVRTQLADDVIVRYAENGVPSFIKGSNLSSALDDDPDFVAYKEKGLFAQVALAFLRSQRELLRVEDPGREFEKADILTDDLQFKHVKFRQTIGGVPIWGRGLTVHLNRDNQVYLVEGRFEPTHRGVNTVATISGQVAAGRALEAAASGGAAGWSAALTEKYIYMVGLDTPRLAYRVTLVRGVADREFYFIDAADGQVISRIPGTVD